MQNFNSDVLPPGLENWDPTVGGGAATATDGSEGRIDTGGRCSLLTLPKPPMIRSHAVVHGLPCASYVVPCVVPRQSYFITAVPIFTSVLGSNVSHEVLGEALCKGRTTAHTCYSTGTGTGSHERGEH